MEQRKYILLVTDHYNPLGILRSLGEKKIYPYVILYAEHPTLINFSRYIKKLYRAKNATEGYDILIKEFGNETVKPIVYTGCDEIVSILDHNYNYLKDRFYFFNAGEENRLTYLMDKSTLSKLAIESGINVPKTQVVQVGELPTELNYPIITKSIDSTSEGWKNNVFICNSAADLQEAYKHIKGERIMLQEFIVKKNELCIDGISINGGNDLYMPLAAQYLRLSNSSYGYYFYFQKFEDKELIDKIKTLFKKTGFSGIFTIEFLIDQNNNYYFLEINFRHSAWGYANTACGINLPYIYAQSIVEGKLKTDSASIKKVPFTGMVEYLDYIHSVRTGKVPFFRWIKELLHTDCLFFWNTKDPLPFFCKFFHLFLGRIWHGMKRKLSL